MISTDCKNASTRGTNFNYTKYRRISQAIAISVFAALPLLDIFRLDLERMAIIICKRQFGLDKAYLILIAIFLSIGIIILLAKFVGRASCSWVCPQTLLNEVIFHTERWIQRQFKAKSRKKSWITQTTATACLLVICAALSVIMGFFIVSYFVSPTSVAAAVIYPAGRPITVKALTAVSTFILFDMLWLRHNFCLACIYGYMQAFTRGDRTLTVCYDNSRLKDCVACEQCVRACYKGLDMRGGYGVVEDRASDSNSTFFCTNCGDCIKACLKVMSKFNKEPILRFSRSFNSCSDIRENY